MLQITRTPKSMEKHHRTRLCLLGFLLSNVSVCVSKRVVVVPLPNVSHTRYLTNVARALVDFGHEIWICLPAAIADQSFFNMSGINRLLYSSTDVDVVEKYMEHVREAFWRDESVDIQRMMSILFDHTETMMLDKDLEQGIRNIKPDLMVIDNPPNMRMIAVLAYKLQIPFAFVGSLYDPIAHRVPFTTATLPSALFAHTHAMNFFQRLISFGTYATMVLFEMFAYTDAVSRFAPERPYLPIRELTSLAEIVLIESDPILDYPKVSLPNVKLIGGTAVSHAQTLQEPFRSFVEKAEEGVVVVSFGSYIVNFPQEVATRLSEAFLRLPWRVVWRVNMTSPDPDHILTSTWIPQNDLVGHPKVKVLVSHCGQSSQYEALFHGVPMLCMPVFLDQPYNAERSRTKGFGLTLDLKTSRVDEIVSHITELYVSELYTKNIKLASKLFKINYGLPKEQAAFWLDHVLEYGGTYMRSSGQTMPGYQFYLLDVFGFCLIVLSVLCLCTFLVCKRLIESMVTLASFLQTWLQTVSSDL